MLVIQGDIYGKQQAEINLNVDATGAADCTTTVKFPWDQVFTYLPTPLTPHPLFTNLLSYEFKVARENANYGSATTTYRGIGVEDPTLFTQEDFSLTATSEPIETHPLFAYPPATPPVTPSDINTINLALENHTTPVGLSSAAQTLYNKKIRGIDSFLRVGAIFRRSYIQAPAALIDYTGVGYIASPPDAPILPTIQNYLFVGFSWRNAAGVRSITEEYQASGLGGWDVDLYSKPP